MLNFHDIVIGKRVRCLQAGRWFGLIGDIVAINMNSEFAVMGIDGVPIGDWIRIPGNLQQNAYWREPGLFEVYVDALDKSVPLTSESFKEGALVVCVYAGKYRGMIGRIHILNEDIYTVKTCNGEDIGDDSWSLLSSFNVVLEDAPIKQEPVAVSLVVPVAVKEKKPCPSYYYGVDHCTCGKCEAKPRMVFR